MRLCVIPARGGSKRIPYKNIKFFFGQPIISYSIKAAIASQCFDKIIVSTDDHDIVKVSESFGASVPFLRPKELANDHTDTISVIKHAIEWFEDQGRYPTEVCCIYATAPFLQEGVIRKAYEKMKQEGVDYCFSAASFEFPIQRAIKVTQEKRVEMYYPECYKIRSQDLEESYHDAGQFYWGKAEAFKQQKTLFSESATPYILPRHLVQDIDTFEDWRRAELMYKVLKQSAEID